MKKIFLFSIIVITLLCCSLVLAQESLIITDPKAEVETQFLNPEAECTGPGELIYDDGTFENGFGWGPTVNDGRIVSLFTPLSYPWQFNTFCLALTRQAAGTSNFTFDIVMYDNTGAGGTPGNQIGIVAGVTATNIPIWTTIAFYDFDISSMPSLASESVYIGIKYNPSLVTSPHFSLVDQTITTPVHPGYVMSGGTPWQTIQNVLPGSRAISYRTLGSSNCPVEPASNPSPANGITYVPVSETSLTWINGAGTSAVEVWFGYQGSVTKVYDGPAITSWSPGLLDYLTTYQWKIVCKNDTCFYESPLWSFMTEPIFWGPFFDDFENGTWQWTITNDGGTCVWDISTLARPYTMPPTASGNVFAADADECGSGSTMLTTATVTNPIDATGYYGLILFFDNDFRVYDGQDEAYVEVSTDEGATWSVVWSVIGVDRRNTTELVDLSFLGGTIFKLRFKSVQPGWDWWWVIDNIYIDYCLSCFPPIPPSNLTAQIIYNPNPQVQLGWQDNSWDEYGFKIYRKYGYPNDPGDYTIIDTTFSNITQFIDTSVLPESTYTYRVFAYNQYGQNGSNTATIAVPVPVELISFTSEVEEDVVTLFWQTATEKNNSGFEIERLKDPKIEKLNDWETIGFVEGKGTTTEIQSYSFTDKTEPGKYKYRLKQLDFDGSFEYSQEIEAEVKAPNVFSLEQNYPNPFNPNTVISYQIPVSSNVTLKVYDVLGNEVATLVDEYRQSGKYEVEFSDKGGSAYGGNAYRLPSGIYFYQLKAGNFIETKKMVLMK
jgi:hypothetical protein